MAAGERSAAGWILEGARQAALGPAWIVGASLMSVGALAHDVGQSALIATLSTLLVWAGPAQLIYFASIGAGVAPLAIATAIVLAGMRFVPMVLSILPIVRGPRTGVATQIAASHFVAVTVWVETMRRAPDLARENRLPFFFGLACACISIAAAMTFVGYQAARALPPLLGAMLLFVSPIYFLVSLMRGAREAMDWIAIGLGLTLAPVMARFVGGGLDLLATGLVAGGSAFAVRFVQRARRTA